MQLCVEIDGTTEKNISVSIDTIPGTALGKLYTASEAVAILHYSQ